MGLGHNFRPLYFSIQGTIPRPAFNGSGAEAGGRATRAMPVLVPALHTTTQLPAHCPTLLTTPVTPRAPKRISPYTTLHLTAVDTQCFRKVAHAWAPPWLHALTFAVWHPGTYNPGPLPNQYNWHSSTNA